MPPEFYALLQQWPSLVLLLLVIDRIVAIMPKIFPEWAKAQAAQATARAEEIQMSRRTEERLFDLAEQVVRSNAELNITMQSINHHLGQQSTLMREVSLDLARIYAFLRIEVRPNSTKEPHESSELRNQP